ncbi:MAG: hypothetical protein K2X34_08135 [Hyphomonadaceae bacterium]|nr:hypothetical protein [Hyphomonadaceae bacterium]
MDFKGLVDKAANAANAAATKAAEAANALSEQARAAAAPAPPVSGEASPEEQALVAADPEGALPAPAQAKGAASFFNTDKLAELQAIGAEKVQQLVTSFQQALPALKAAGYELTEFEIEIGVTPKLIPHFRHAVRSEENVGAAREMLKDNKLGQMLLGALLKAGDIHKQINVAGFGFSHIEIEMGLIPSVRLQYKNEAIGA